MTMGTSRTRRSTSAAAAVLATAALALASAPPRDVVVRTTDAVIAILKDPETSKDTKRTRIEEVVYANVDFDTLTRLVMARNWRRLSPAQQVEFRNEFKRHLSVTYGNNIDSYRNEGVEVIGEREEARGDRTVLTRVVRSDGGTNDILVDYRLRQTDGEWRIIDVIVEGVSMVANFRSQFQDIVAGGSPEKLIVLLREKNQKGEAIITPTTP
jgi:phospholipid transport system substrate-binding protein